MLLHVLILFINNLISFYGSSSILEHFKFPHSVKCQSSPSWDRNWWRGESTAVFGTGSPAGVQLQALGKPAFGLLRSIYGFETRLCRRRPACLCWLSVFAGGRERACPPVLPWGLDSGEPPRSSSWWDPLGPAAFGRAGDFQSDFCGAFASICAEQMDVKNRTDVRTETRMWQEEVQERERFIQTDPSLAAVCVARAAVLVRTGGLNCLRWRLGYQRLLHSTQV